MEEKKDFIGFSITRVSTEQFAIIEEAFEASSPINLNTNLRFAIDRDNRMVVAFTLFKFEQKNIPFLLVEVSCHFAISPGSWNKFMKEDSTIIIPKDFMSHLGAITAGTTRGVLHTKTEGTRFNIFVLPTINVTDLIKDDVSFVEAKE